MAIAAPVIKSGRVTAFYCRNDQSIMAQSHREQTKAPLTASLADLWPSVAYLQSIEHTVREPQRSAIELYHRNAGYLTMLGRVAAGDIEGARRIARGLPGTHADRAAAISLALRLPAPLLKAGLKLRRRLRG
jgi:hypothetical protein